MKKIVAFFRELWAIIIQADRDVVILRYKPRDEDVWHELFMERWQVPRFTSAFRAVIESYEVRDEAI